MSFVFESFEPSGSFTLKMLFPSFSFVETLDYGSELSDDDGYSSLLSSLVSSGVKISSSLLFYSSLLSP